MNPIICIVWNCDRPARRKSVCDMHNHRLRQGTPLDQAVGRALPTDIAIRLWAKVKVADALDCWEWIASLNSEGYGQIYHQGRPHRAHRIAYELLIADIPEGLTIDHLCRNRRCVNPWHMEPVPLSVNSSRASVGRTYTLKTECNNGHPYSDDNVRIDPVGHRRCRQCERRSALAAYYRRKAREAA
jgi:hypothetical protein